MFDWGDIRIFLAVATEGSTIAAAKRLGMNQSTVSRRVSAFETAVGLKLFDRTQAGYRLTSLGSALLDATGQMDASAKNVQLRIDRLRRDESGVIRLSAPALVMNRWGFRTIADFQSSYPEVEFDVDSSETPVSLEQGAADIAFRAADKLSGDELIAKKVGDVIWSVYATRDYILRHGTPRSIADLREHDIFFYTANVVRRIGFLKDLDEKISGLRVLQRVNTVSGMIGSVQTGNAVGIIPRSGVGNNSDFICCFDSPEFSHPLWVVTSKDAHAQPLVKNFFRFAAKSLRSVRPDLLR